MDVGKETGGCAGCAWRGRYLRGAHGGAVAGERAQLGEQRGPARARHLAAAARARRARPVPARHNTHLRTRITDSRVTPTRQDSHAQFYRDRLH